ncbi:hypothetical protein BTS2_2068 [Bacillus sp. TS-2]|nr:hypothetical protein BTS2_2068 [Bacillus sp. TS-2]
MFSHPNGKHSTSKTYEDFMKNECELVVLVIDSCYVTVYCENKEKVERLYQNAVECGFINIEYITDENDTRTVLASW